MISPEYESGLVSVIIPTYNRGHYIKETIQSVIEQTYRPIEIIIIDDGSTDSTKQIILNIKKSLQNNKQIRIRYVYQENSGAQVARNRGLFLSKGEFIQFFDSDDLLSPDKIRNQVNALRNEPEFDIAYGSWKTYCSKKWTVKYGPLRQNQAIDSNDKMLRLYLSSEWFCPSHSYLFRRKTIISVGLFDEKLLRRQDTDYLIRTLINGHQFLFVNNALVYYRRDGGEHIGNPKNYKEHFLSSLLVIENAYAMLIQQGRTEQYSEEIIKYLIHLADESLYMGHENGTKIVIEKINRWFPKISYEYDSHVKTSKHHFIKRLFVRLAKQLIGDCTLDWINKTAKREG